MLDAALLVECKLEEDPPPNEIPNDELAAFESIGNCGLALLGGGGGGTLLLFFELDSFLLESLFLLELESFLLSYDSV